MERKVLHIGAVAVVCALVLRLLSGSLQDLGLKLPEHQQIASVLLFLGTGRLVRPAETDAPSKPVATEPAAVTESSEPEKTPAALFSAEDAELVEVGGFEGYTVDVSALLQQPLNWDLTEGGPAVLILHSHGTESYTKTEDYQETVAYRTRNTGYNVVSIGDRVAALLEEGGIRVIHDRSMHDDPSYSNAYSEARRSIESYLEEYPSIRMVLDIHRDSAEDANGNQFHPVRSTESGDAAQLMMVVGTDAGGFDHPLWQENMALAIKLHTQLQKQYPGICRPISLRSSRFNQDLSTGAMLIEVGSAGNTRQEALLAAQILSEGILSLAHGTESEVY